MAVTSGTRVGHYEILAPLGAGGMGEVWRARDTTLKRDVALKLLPPSFANDSDRMARFQREAEVLASLNHPNIAHIFGVAQAGDVRALAMELVEGESPHGPLPFDEAWNIASQIALALEYAHERGVIHRDLKPANIKVTPDGTVKLLDFGLAKAFTPPGAAPRETSPEQSPTLTIAATEAGMILGTASYMSPEQARGKPVDKRADIWAFGVVLYELLAGARPFEGEDIGETLAAVIRHNTDLTRVPARARELIRSCLEKDPKRRLRDIGDAERLLSVAQQAPARASRPRLAWIAASALAVAIAASGALKLHRPPAAQPQVLRLEIEPPEGGRFSLDAMASGMAISPDSATLTYVASGRDGINRLWLRVLSERSPRPLPGTERAAYPFWSPDGSTIAFFNDKNLMRIDVNGTGLQAITDTTSGRGGVWLPDGRIVFGGYGRADALRIVPATGGNAPALVPAGAGRWPQALPGSRLMYFVLHPERQESNAAYVTSLDKPGASTRMMNVPQSPVYVPGMGATDYLLWQRGTALVGQAINRATLQRTGPVSILADPVDSGAVEGQLYVTASQSGPLIYCGIPHVTQFTWFDRAGRVLGTVGAPGAYHFGSFRISPDARTIGASIDQPGGDQMGLVETARGVFNGLPMSGNNSFPAWAPDSLAVTYGRTIFDLATNSSAPGPGGPWDWSPDGRQLLSRRLVEGVRNEILIHNMTPDRKPEGEPRIYADGMSARFSPDGRWVAYSSDESGQDEVYMAAFPSALRKIRVSTAGGDFPAFSPDAREVYYVAPGNKLTAVSVTIRGDSVQPTPPTELFVLPVSDTPLGPFDVAKDGRFLVRADVPQSSGSLTAIVNWQALIK